uniref:Uncharacterized protein n=1 Tax=Acrobeloides nanus TaxID=290746 RepID=A0A914CKX4_9BILA
MQVEKYFAIMNNEYWRDEEGKVPVFVASEVSNPFMILIVLCATTMSSVSYVLIITFNIKVWKKLRESRHIMSAKTQQLQKQLTHVLIIQQHCPFWQPLYAVQFYE